MVFTSMLSHAGHNIAGVVKNKQNSDPGVKS